MTVIEPVLAKTSAPRERLLRTASDLFYREGIHAVGVDRIVAEGAVTRATFYRHFPSKEDLVVAYLEAEDAALRGALTSAGEQLAASDRSPEELLEVIIQAIANDVSAHHTRGCPFINASAEYPDPTSAVRVTVANHRIWFRAVVESALTAAGHEDAADRAGALVLLRDAALVGGYLDGPEIIRDTFVRTARLVAGL